MLETAVAQVQSSGVTPIRGMILLGLVVAAGLILLMAAKGRGRALMVLLGAACLLSAFMFASHVERADTTLENYEYSLSAAVALVEESSGDPTTQQLWNQLTESKIDLDDSSSEEELAGADAEGEEVVPQSAKPRPAWIDAEPRLVGTVYSRVVSSGPYKSIAEFHRALEPMLRQAVADRLAMLIREEQGEDFPLPSLDALGVGLPYILSELCTKEYTETRSASFGEVKETHVLLEFRHSEDTHLVTLWRNYVRQARLQSIGIGAAICLGALALGYLGLSLDTWTRGYYTKRLLVGGAAAIIVLLILAIS